MKQVTVVSILVVLLVTAASTVRGASQTSASVDSCDKDPNSYLCMIERDREAEPDGNVRAQYNDIKEFGDMVARLEDTLHRWACSATGIPLFGAHGDGDVINFGYSILSQSLTRSGQQYGSSLITEFLNKREKQDARKCNGPEEATFNAANFNSLQEAVLQYKENIQSWLRRNEVDPADIIGLVVPQLRTLFGRWGIARLLAIEDIKRRVPPEEVPLAVLPLLADDEESAEERCTAAGQLYQMYIRTEVKPAGGGDDAATTPSSPRLRREVERLLDECYQSGRVSAKPADFGETLLTAERESQARELFDLAVQRGSLCNAYQRPEMLHRKDLSAFPVWSMDSFPRPVFRGFLALQDLLADRVRKADFLYSNDTETMRMFLEKGWWERTMLYASHTWQQYNCEQFGLNGCDKIKKLADLILESNDAYATQCNGSLAFDLWRLSPDVVTYRATGQSNIVLQLIMPLVTHGSSLLLNIGEEAVRIEEGELIVIDDSFENVLQVQVEGADEASTADEPIVVFHAQLCHPEFHERALDLPSKKCKRR